MITQSIKMEHHVSLYIHTKHTIVVLLFRDWAENEIINLINIIIV